MARKKYSARVQIPIPLKTDPAGWDITEVLIEGISAGSQRTAKRRAETEAEIYCVDKFSAVSFDGDPDEVPMPKVVAISRVNEDGECVNPNFEKPKKRVASLVALNQHMKDKYKARTKAHKATKAGPEVPKPAVLDNFFTDEVVASLKEV